MILVLKTENPIKQLTGNNLLQVADDKAFEFIGGDKIGNKSIENIMIK
jgi:hypothetical protein